MIRKSILHLSLAWGSRIKFAYLATFLVGFFLLIQQWLAASLNLRLPLIVIFSCLAALVIIFLLKREFLSGLVANIAILYLAYLVFVQPFELEFKLFMFASVPVLLYLVNPRALFYPVSLTLFALLLDVYRLPEGTAVQQLLSVQIYFQILLAVTVLDILHARSTSRMLSYFEYSDSRGVLKEEAASDLLDKLVANAIRYEHELAVVVFEFGSDSAVAPLPGSEQEKQLMQRISSNIRRGDTLAKWKGNSFILIAPEGNLEGCTIMLKKLRRIAADYRTGQAQGLRLFHGISVLTEKGHAELISSAESSLEEEKRQAM